MEIDYTTIQEILKKYIIEMGVALECYCHVSSHRCNRLTKCPGSPELSTLPDRYLNEEDWLELHNYHVTFIVRLSPGLAHRVSSIVFFWDV